jgi:DNA-binding LacI/PurR family transcriptional regulator
MPTKIAEHRPSAGTTGVSKSSIAQELRLRIVKGEFQPGSRLPTRSVLEQHFGTTTLTVQRAFDDLAQDGFITTDGRRGTFVAEAPPHLTRHALVFTGSPSDAGNWSPFWKTLCAEAARIEAQGKRKIPCYYFVNERRDSADYKRLLRDIRMHQLAGIVYAFNPDLLEGSALLEAALEAGGTPSVALASSGIRQNMPVVSIRYSSFFERALDEIALRGRKRVAVLTPVSLAAYSAARFQEAVASRGLFTQPYWWQPVSLASVSTAYFQSHLLMNPDQMVRPDALIIANDNLVEPVIEGLRAAGVRVPEDVEIVAHCNFPLTAPAAAPMRRLGFNVRHVLQACLDSIDCQRDGRTAPRQVKISAVFEVEIILPDEVKKN